MKRRVKNLKDEQKSGAHGASLSIEGELALASMNPFLPSADLHGLPREAVAYEIDRLIHKNPQSSIRIIYGIGKGILKTEVMRYLSTRLQQKESDILGFTPEMSDGSCVARVR